VLDTAAVERDVATELSTGAAAGVVVDCPDRMAIEVGATHACWARIVGETAPTIVITVTDEDGGYTWAEA
jgi:hypothetical protein